MVTSSFQAFSPAARLSARERRRTLEEAAAHLFAQQGYEGTTVEEIVAAAGVSKPMLYRHFESKKDMAMRIMEHRRDELAAAPLDEFLRSPGPASLHAMVDAWFGHVERHPDSCRLLFRDAIGDPDVRALQDELRGRQRAADVALIETMAPHVPPHEREALGEIIRSSLTGLALWWLDRPGVPREVVVAATVRMTHGLLAAGEQG